MSGFKAPLTGLQHQDRDKGVEATFASTGFRVWGLGFRV